MQQPMGVRVKVTFFCIYLPKKLHATRDTVIRCILSVNASGSRLHATTNGRSNQSHVTLILFRKEIKLHVFKMAEADDNIEVIDDDNVIDNFELIDCYKMYPCLFDTKAVQYHNRNIKNKAYAIANKFGTTAGTFT